MYDAAVKLGADTIATGHYIRTERDDEENPVLLKGLDSLKEQSYFLSMLSHRQLKNTLFPLGEYTKQEVIEIASENHLVPLEKKESQDICFIHDSTFAEFIVSKTGMKFTPGDIVTTDNKVVGRHRGLHCYTIGQRRGLNCPGPEPYYVKSIDMINNRLIVGFRKELYSDTLNVRNVNWLSPCTEFSWDKPMKVMTKIRYSHTDAPSTLFPSSESTAETLNKTTCPNHIKIIFDSPQFAVTPGQGAVFYKEDKVIGAGIIQ
ncbi:tRNA-specific 2-thiouridylase mnmA (fragment) [Desulfamplus magnetovallimortis]|uniref:tRNA-uridine 2-sulfurtransferase n=1 Tax=Desulfamplus magnetovallimortis TaxID=1246637 RepID=A0A1W1H5G7_9BACT